MATLSETEQLDWLQLIRTEQIGPITFHRLLKKYGSARKALNALPELSRKAGRAKPMRIAPRGQAEAEFERAHEYGAQIIAFPEPHYPALLREIHDPPPLLFVHGHHSLFEKPAIAIVGARNASGVGLKMARELASGLGAAGYAVVSGLARGIDGAAHGATLKTGTVAVVAGGVDVIYPPEHKALTEAIGAQGAVISEQPIGRRPTARDFPKRNRLISGLCRGVVVVEASAKSGTLITARFAAEQGREVFAVPGSPLDPRCHGANGLIRDGANLVQSADDIITALQNQAAGLSAAGRDTLFDWAQGMDETAFDETGDAHTDFPLAADEALEERVLSLLGYTPIHSDDVLQEIDAPPGLIMDALLSLILAGKVEECDGGRFSLLTPPDGSISF